MLVCRALICEYVLTVSMLSVPPPPIWYVDSSWLYDMKESGANFLLPSPIASTNEIVNVWDPEVGKINPSEHKQLKLARSLTRGIIDRDLKPSSNERK